MAVIVVLTNRHTAHKTTVSYPQSPRCTVNIDQLTKKQNGKLVVIVAGC